MNIIEEIKKLKLLLEQGAITQEEFDLLKKKLLVQETEAHASVYSKNEAENISNENESTNHGNKTVAKVRRTRKVITTAIIAIVLIYIFYPYKTWEKKQFDNYDELVEAFKDVSYKAVKKEFGEPYYKFLDVTGQTIDYCWHGVGVKGHPDAHLVFNAMEYATGFFMGFEFKYVNEHEGYWAPSNDNYYNIE
jgi:predicted secreted protein